MQLCMCMFASTQGALPRTALLFYYDLHQVPGDLLIGNHQQQARTLCCRCLCSDACAQLSSG